MKNFIRIFRLILILLLPLLNIPAQTGKTFISSDGGFAINLPEKPDENSVLEEGEAFYLGIGKSFQWNSVPVKYLIQYIKIDTFEKPLTTQRQTSILDDARQRSLNTLKDHNVMTREKNILLNGKPGIEIMAIFPNAGRMIFRTFLIDKKLYKLIVAIYDVNIANEATKVLDSFRILDKPEIVAQKLKETVIDPLPQTPVAEKLKSDAEDNNLKGKVKSVVEEDQENAKSARELSSEDYFNEQGNLVKQINYINGYPYSLTVWGYIDGNRVDNERSVDYNGEEYELLGILQMISTETDKKPRDERYNYKYKYKYNEKGNLIEEWIYFNDGDLWLRRVYNFKGNTKENITYDEDGKLNSKRIEILDKNGNVIEETQFDYRGKQEGRISYTYEFDSQGNWTIQKSFEKKIVKGKLTLKPSFINYRTLTYYN